MSSPPRLRRLLPAVLVVLALLPAAAVSAQGTAPAPAPDPEVIGGTRADPGEYPFQVALLQHAVRDRWEAQFCGGTLISPDTVLTAAHCVRGSRARDIDILAGTTELRPGGGQRVRARALRVHPRYNDATLHNDIAVIQLGVNLPYPIVRPSVPGDYDLYPEGTMATTIGWGDQDIRLHVQSYPRDLREVEVPIVSDADCVDAYPGELMVNLQVCAGDMVNGGEDSCYGDSGGPLLVPDGSDWVQIGVVSTGRGCARRPFPGIYTEVTAFDRFVVPFLDPDSVPARVTRLRQRKVTPTAMRIRWRAPFFDGGTRITAYRIEVPALHRRHTVDGDQTFVRLRHLPRGRHLVHVRAINRIGASSVRSFVITV